MQQLETPQIYFKRVYLNCFYNGPQEEVATHSSIIDRRIPGREEPSGLQSLQLQSQTDRATERACVMTCSLLVVSQRRCIHLCFPQNLKYFPPLKTLMQASLVAQTMKNLPAIQQSQVLSLGREDPLGKETATHSRILAWEIPRTEKPGRLQFMGSEKSRI